MCAPPPHPRPQLQLACSTQEQACLSQPGGQGRVPWTVLRLAPTHWDREQEHRLYAMDLGRGKRGAGPNSWVTAVGDSRLMCHLPEPLHELTCTCPSASGSCRAWAGIIENVPSTRSP